MLAEIQLKNCKIMIIDYDLQFELYSFKTLNKFDKRIMFGNSYYSLGTISNFTDRNDLIDLRDQIPNNLISKINFGLGDIVVNDVGVKLYENTSTSFISKSDIKFGFENNGVNILLYNIQGLFYYFGSNLKSGDKIIKLKGESSETIQTHIYTVKSVISHIVTFEYSDVQYLNLLVPNYDDIRYVFYK